MDTYSSRKQFIESQSATCDNWNWSWSFVNHDEKLVIFGAWNIHDKGIDGQKILSEEWALTAKGKGAPGYQQSVYHVTLVVEEEYELKTFPIIYSDENHDEFGIGPAKIESFTPILSAKRVNKDGLNWVAFDTDAQRAETAKVAQAMMGDKLYQQRAREALPILVRQALAEKPITYESLAEELGMPNPRNLNYVLGSIGRTLIDVSEQLPHFGDIPPVQCVVVNKSTGLPGEGIGWFLENSDIKKYKRMSLNQQQKLVDTKLEETYRYGQWKEVLHFLGLQPHKSDYVGGELSKKSGTGFNGGGEGLKHKVLKEFVAENPTCIGLPKSCKNGEIEYSLPSGDSVDVMFYWRGLWVPVEVKSSISGLEDIRRGLYQCIKYRAVTEAYQGVMGRQKNVRSILVIETAIPLELVPLKNALGIEVLTVEVE